MHASVINARQAKKMHLLVVSSLEVPLEKKSFSKHCRPLLIGVLIKKTKVYVLCVEFIMRWGLHPATCLRHGYAFCRDRAESLLYTAY